MHVSIGCIMCRIEGLSSQRGLATPRFIGKWAPEDAKKRLPSILSRSLDVFEFFTTHRAITQHLREQIEQNYEYNVTFCDGMMLVGGDLPKGASLHCTQVFTYFEYKFWHGEREFASTRTTERQNSKSRNMPESMISAIDKNLRTW
jgi:hypothetical protein